MKSFRLASPHLSLIGYEPHTALRLRSGVQRVSRSQPVGKRQPQLVVQSRARRRTTLHAARSGTTTAAWEPGEECSVIREWLLNTELPPPLTPSSYDTAWVAMVPAAPAGCPASPPTPRYPRCLAWIREHQRSDGSWGPAGSHDDPTLRKDAISSTLACVLALRTWDVGDEIVAKGLRFICCNWSFVTDDKCDTPLGFNIIFPCMLTRALDMGLEIPVPQADIDAILRLRDRELNGMASSGSKAFMAYVAEGLGNLLDWDEAMPFQRKNGSFFNSPAATAAAAIQIYNERALDYLDSVVSMFGSSVPTVYPRNVYSRLRIVDTLEKMGISRNFSFEINNTLGMIYRSWLANDEEIMLDMATCAMAFRLLRMHAYDVSSRHLYDTEALLELFKALQVQISEDELILENIGSWSSKLLKQQLCSNMISRPVDRTEVEHVLKFPFYTTLDRLEHRWNIQHFKKDGFLMLKSAYSTTRTRDICTGIRTCNADKEIVSLAANGFHSSQAVYQEELECLKSWAKEVRLDKLDFARVMPLICLFPAAATMFPSELSEARIAQAKNSILATIVDDLFDVEGTMEEMENLVMLMEMWDAHEEVGFCSERVEIVFRAVYDTSNQLAVKAAALQNRSVIHHIAELWVEMVRAMMVEAKWMISGDVPSIKEYMLIGQPSFGLGPMVQTTLYLMGPQLSDDMVRCPSYNELFRHMNICGRLLNDLRSYEREKEQGKINSIILLAHYHHGGSMEAAKEQVRSAIAASRRELLRMVVTDGGVVPRPCRHAFWNLSKVLHYFYMEVDGYVSPKEMMHAGNGVVVEPLRLPCLESI